MGILDEMRVIERLQFFNGQGLFAEDLQNIEAFNREMRWLHNGSLHQEGVGGGLSVSGEEGDREVVVGSGYAIDSLGREIVLTVDHVEPVPPVESDDEGRTVLFDLTVSYPSADDLEVAETREGLCAGRGAVRLREEPVFCWVRLERDESGGARPRDPKLAADIESGMKILLGRVEVQSCQLKSLSVAERRNALPASQPYLACGHARPVWRVVQVNDLFIVMEATVDTAAAGFVNVPCYSARIDGPRELAGIEPADEFVAEAFVSIENPLPDQFEVRLLVVVFGDMDVLTEQEENLPQIFEPWGVVWMGVE